MHSNLINNNLYRGLYQIRRNSISQMLRWNNLENREECSTVNQYLFVSKFNWMWNLIKYFNNLISYITTICLSGKPYIAVPAVGIHITKCYRHQFMSKFKRIFNIMKVSALVLETYLSRKSWSMPYCSNCREIYT